jgi:hypothetical protein
MTQARKAPEFTQIDVSSLDQDQYQALVHYLEAKALLRLSLGDGALFTEKFGTPEHPEKAVLKVFIPVQKAKAAPKAGMSLSAYREARKADGLAS